MSQAQTIDRLPGVPPQKRRRRWRLWVGVPLFLFVLWLTVFYLFFVYFTDRDLREAMAEADRQSPKGWRLEDIEARREQIPDEENAALLVLKVPTFLPTLWPRPVELSQAEGTQEKEGVAGASSPPPSWDERLSLLPPEVQLDAALVRDLRASLAEVKAARGVARKLIGMTRGRFPNAGHYNLFLNSREGRSAATLLGYEAALAAQDGDADAPLDFVRGQIGAARSVGDEPYFLPALFRLGCDAQAVAALERTLAQGEPSARALETVQALLQKEASEPLLARVVRGERAAVHQELLSIKQGSTSLAWYAGVTGGIDRALLDACGPTMARRSHALILRLLNECVAASELPLGDQAAVMDNVRDKVFQEKRPPSGIVTRYMMPAIPLISWSYHRGVGNLRCAFVAVALERYRRDHGRWPDRLDALVPKYLALVPKDPQDGKPLRYKHRPDGVIVYWIGADGTDDGGKRDRLNWMAKGTDEGFQLWDVTRRRQPARELLPTPRAEPAP
jgi:hypothetical protein